MDASQGLEPQLARSERDVLPLDEEAKMAPAKGFEPLTLELTAPCSAIELRRNKFRFFLLGEELGFEPKLMPSQGTVLSL